MSLGLIRWVERTFAGIILRQLASFSPSLISQAVQGLLGQLLARPDFYFLLMEQFHSCSSHYHDDTSSLDLRRHARSSSSCVVSACSSFVRHTNHHSYQPQLWDWRAFQLHAFSASCDWYTGWPPICPWPYSNTSLQGRQAACHDSPLLQSSVRTH